MEAEHNIRESSCKFCARAKLPEKMLNADFCDRV